MTPRQRNYVETCRKSNPNYTVIGHERPGDRLLVEVACFNQRRGRLVTVAIVLLGADGSVEQATRA